MTELIIYVLLGVTDIRLKSSSHPLSVFTDRNLLEGRDDTSPRWSPSNKLLVYLGRVVHCILVELNL